MGGTAPAHQPRLSFTGSEDGEAETETWSGEALVATDDSKLRPARAQLAEPPYADPPVRWCGRGEQVTAPPIPIATKFSFAAHGCDVDSLIRRGTKTRAGHCARGPSI